MLFSWTVLEDQVALLILGFILTLLVSAASVALPALKSKITTKLFSKNTNSSLLIKETDSEIIDSDEDQPIPSSTKELLFGFFFIFIYSLLHIATMMLIMTYNGYVIIFVIIGLALGYIFFGMDCDKDKNVPVNCCA